MHGIHTTKSTETPAAQHIPKLSFENDNAFPSMAKILSLKETKKFGKHMVTTEDINTGKIVIASHAFATVDYLVCTSQGCFDCGKTMRLKIQCPHCIDVWFCSNICKKSRLHRAKCDTSFESIDCRVTRLSIQMIITACNAFEDIGTMFDYCKGLLFLKKSAKKCHPPYSQYGELLALTGNVESNNALIARRVVDYTVSYSTKLQSVSMDQEKMRILFSLAYRHANTISLNAFEDKIICSKGGACIKFSIHDILSRINHSCDPNIDNYLGGDNVMYCVAARPIKFGQQLLINYVHNMGFESSEQRRKYLKETWHFDCKCKFCRPPKPGISNSDNA